jgi:hypothetical protein
VDTNISAEYAVSIFRVEMCWMYNPLLYRQFTRSVGDGGDIIESRLIGSAREEGLYRATFIISQEEYGIVRKYSTIYYKGEMGLHSEMSS